MTEVLTLGVSTVKMSSYKTIFKENALPPLGPVARNSSWKKKIVVLHMALLSN